MKNLKSDRSSSIGKTIALPISLFIILILGIYMGVMKFDRIHKEQNLILIEQAAKKAAIECYAIEGVYPADLSYLEDNYYLNIDHNNYYVIYDSIASNFMPDIQVFER